MGEDTGFKYCRARHPHGFVSRFCLSGEPVLNGDQVFIDSSVVKHVITNDIGHWRAKSLDSDSGVLLEYVRHIRPVTKEQGE